MAIIDLFVAASNPVLKVLIVTALGSFLALDHVNILGDEARKHMNNIVFFVFNPSLVGVNLAKTITPESMMKLWFMPFNILITVIIGSALGWVVNKVTKAPTHLRGLVLGCCAAGNLGNILLIIIPAVCKEKGSPFGDPIVCHEFGMAYASLSMAVGAVFLWSYVYNIIRISSKKEAKVVDSSPIVASVQVSVLERESCEEPLLLSEDIEVPQDKGDPFALPCTSPGGKKQTGNPDTLRVKVSEVLRKLNIKRVLAPSTIGSIVGFVVGLVPLIRTMLIGDEAPFRVIEDSATLLGEGAIPAVTLIMGGNLLKGLRESGMQKSILIGIVTVRYIILPLLGIFIVKGALSLGLVQADPLYHFVLLIQYAVPPAMNIGTITQLFGAGENECSVIMLWSYALASVALTLWSTFFMWLVAA